MCKEKIKLSSTTRSEITDAKTWNSQKGENCTDTASKGNREFLERNLIFCWRVRDHGRKAAQQKISKGNASTKTGVGILVVGVFWMIRSALHNIRSKRKLPLLWCCKCCRAVQQLCYTIWFKFLVPLLRREKLLILNTYEVYKATW